MGPGRTVIRSASPSSFHVGVGSGSCSQFCCYSEGFTLSFAGQRHGGSCLINNLLRTYKFFGIFRLASSSQAPEGIGSVSFSVWFGRSAEFASQAYLDALGDESSTSANEL